MDGTTKHKFSKKTCCFENIPLAIVSNPLPKNRKPSTLMRSFFGVYKERCKDDLGTVNRNWFCDKTDSEGIVQDIEVADTLYTKTSFEGTSESSVDQEIILCPEKRERESNVTDLTFHDLEKSCISDKTGGDNEQHMLKDFVFKTPSRRLYAEKSKQLSSTPVCPSPLSSISTPSLFSQDDSHVPRGKCNAIESPSTMFSALSPATPGNLAITPYQALSSTFRSPSPFATPHTTLSAKHCSPYAPSSSFTHNASFSTLEDTPKFMEQLLMNQTSRNKKSHSEVSGGSSSKLIPLSLGIDNEANLSWTSSLATPPISSSGNSAKSSTCFVREVPAKQSGIIARALFTDRNVLEDTFILDSQNETNLLDLAKTSSDEDEQEMTIESEKFETTLQPQETTESMNLLQEKITLRKDQDCCERIKDGCVKSEKTLLEQCGEGHGSKNVASNEVAESLFNSPKHKHTTELQNDVMKMSSIIVDKKNKVDTQLSESKVLKCDYERIVQNLKSAHEEPSPSSMSGTPLSQVLVNEILTKLTPGDNSNIADTLAFLLDTPPERRRKLSKKKPPPKKATRRSKRKRKTNTNDKDKHLETDSNTEDSLLTVENERTKNELLHKVQEVNVATNINQSLQQISEPIISLVLEDKNDAVNRTCVQLGNSISNNSNHVFVTPSEKCQHDPFSQISPSLIDALCTVTDAVSITTNASQEQYEKAIPENLSNKDILSEECCQPEDKCNLLSSGAKIVLSIYNKQNNNSNSAVDSCNKEIPDAGCMQKQKSSKSSFTYPSAVEQSKPATETRTVNLFDTVLNSSRPTFIYATKDDKEESPKKFQWMNNATVVKEDSDDGNSDKERIEKGEMDVTSLPTFQEKPRCPIRKGFVTFSTFFDHEAEDSNSCNSSDVKEQASNRKGKSVQKVATDIDVTPSSRKGKHLQNRHGQPRCKRPKLDEKLSEKLTSKSSHNLSGKKDIEHSLDSFNKKDISVLQKLVDLDTEKNIFQTEITKQKLKNISGVNVKGVNRTLDGVNAPNVPLLENGQHVKERVSKGTIQNVTCGDSMEQDSEETKRSDTVLLANLENDKLSNYSRDLDKFHNSKMDKNFISTENIVESNDTTSKISRDYLINLSRLRGQQCVETSKASTSDEMECNVDNLEVFDDFVSATQAQKEIAAADEAEMVYAFMQEEDDDLIEEVNMSENLEKYSNVQIEQVRDQHKEIEEFMVPNKNDHLESCQIESNEIKTEIDYCQSRLCKKYSGDISRPHKEMNTMFQTTKRTQYQETEKNEHCLDHVVPNSTSTSNLPSKNASVHNSEKNAFVGFMTGNGEKVNISDEALKIVKKSFSDLEDDTNLLIYTNNTETRSNTSKPTIPKNLDMVSPFVGFKTGRGNKVKISEEALRKAKQALETGDIPLQNGDMEDSGGHPPNPVELPSSDCGYRFDGFLTGKGNKVNISEESLKKVKQTVNDIVNDLPMRGTDPSVRTDNKVHFLGFMTGRGNKVNISKESLKKVKQKFVDDDDILDYLPPKEDNLSSVKAEVERPFAGFMTAKGNKVNISEESLKKVKQSFEDEDIVGDLLPKEQNPSFVRAKVKSPYAGFMTGRGNKVKISEESLKKVKQTFGDYDIADDLFPKETNAPSVSVTAEVKRPIVGFVTGKGDKVKISEESLKKVKQKFDDDNDDDSINYWLLKKTGPSSVRAKEGKPFSGFMTGRGNKVNISEESLKKVKNTFKDDDIKVDPFYSKAEMERPFVGFTTGKGDKVKISEESLKKVKQTYENDDYTNETSLKNTFVSHVKPDTTFVGFLTGKGKTVKVSEDSLKNVRRKFDEESCNDVIGNITSSEIIQTNSKARCNVLKTPGGTSASVSMDSFRKMKDLAGHDVAVEPPIKSDGKCPWFLTGRGKEVNISDDAIRHGKKFLSNATDSTLESPLDTPGVSSDLSFFTAQGSKVNIIGEAVNTIKGCIENKLPNGEASAMQDALHQELEKISQRKMSMQTRNQSFKNMKETSKCFGNFRQPLEQPSTAETVPEFGKRGTVTFKPSPEHILQDRILSGSMSQYKPLKSQPNSTGFRQGRRLRSEVTCQSDPGNSSFVTPFKEVISSRLQSGPQPSRLFDKRSPCRSVHGKPFAKKLKLDLLDITANNQLKSEDGIIDSEGTGKVDGNAGHDESARTLRSSQMKRIQAKRNYTVKPLKGILRQKRQSLTRMRLSDAVDGEPPGRFTKDQMFIFGVLPSTVQINATSADEFQFLGSNYYSEEVIAYGGIKLADGGTLIFNDAGRAGKKEFYNSLLDTPGVDPRLVTQEWVSNHYRWIVWKLASIESSYPKQFGGRLLSPESVLLRLKYRYDREVDESQRSAIKMITERDDTPSKTMVLCVAAVYESMQALNTSSSPDKANKCHITLLLTDGWYSIPTSTDPALQRLVKTGKLAVGQKIIIHGAELTGSQDACPPLEAPSSLRLKISANSTRRARYDTRLGYQRNPQAFTVLLSSLYPDGGMVSCLDVVVTRSYPLMYMERLAEGGCVFRTEKSERKAAAEYARNHQKRMEEIYDRIRSKFEDASTESCGVKRQKCRKLTVKEIAALQTGHEIYDSIEAAFDPSSIKIHLTTEQHGKLQAYQTFLMDKRHAEMQAEIRRVIGQQNQENSKRTVTPLLKVRLVDYNLCERSLSTNVLLTVWRPPEEVVNLFKEGQRLQIFNVSASAAWNRDGSNQVQLASTRSTRYKELASSPVVADIVYSPRAITTFVEFSNKNFKPDYQEVDVVGLVMYVIPYNCSGNSSRPQTVYLCDKDVNIFALKFWGGMKEFHVEEIMTPSSFVCITNLQWRGLDKRSMAPCGHVNDMTVITQNPRRKYLKDALQNLQDHIRDPLSFIKLNQDVIEELSVSNQPQTPVTPYSQPALPPPPPPLTTPRIEGTGKLNRLAKPSPSPSFAVPQVTPVLPKNKFTTPKSQDFRSYYSKRLYSKDMIVKTEKDLNDPKILHSQQGCETPKTTGQHEENVKTSRTPLLSTPVNNAGLTFPLFSKKAIIPKSQNFSSYYKSHNLTVKSGILTTPLSKDHLTSTPISAKKENQIRMNSLKFQNLSRIPSPPPLEPLVSSQCAALKKSYRKPLDQTCMSSTILQPESCCMDDHERQALDAGFSNRTLALEDSGDFDFSEDSPKKDVETDLNEFKNTSCLSQISDIPTQLLRDIDLSGLEEITSSTSSVGTLDGDDSLNLTSTLTQLSETMVREIEAMEESATTKKIVREINAMGESPLLKTEKIVREIVEESASVTTDTIVREVEVMKESTSVNRKKIVKDVEAVEKATVMTPENMVSEIEGISALTTEKMVGKIKFIDVSQIDTKNQENAGTGRRKRKQVGDSRGDGDSISSLEVDTNVCASSRRVTRSTSKKIFKK